MVFKYHSLTPLAREVYHPAVRRITAKSALRHAALACILALAGCSAGARSPSGAVRALAEAAAAGDREGVFALVGPRTRHALEVGAATAAQLSGRRRVQPIELLAVGWFPPTFQLSEVRELDRHGNEATVEVSSKAGHTARVSCVRVDGNWRVELLR